MSITRSRRRCDGTKVLNASEDAHSCTFLISSQIVCTRRLHPTGKQRKAERDTLNADDFIFVKQRWTDTILNAKERDGTYLASLVIGIARNH